MWICLTYLQKYVTGITVIVITWLLIHEKRNTCKLRCRFMLIGSGRVNIICYGLEFITLSNFLKTYTLPYSWASHWKLIHLLTIGFYKTDDVVVTQTIIKGYYIEYKSTSGTTWTRVWTRQRHRISGPRAWAMRSFVRIWEGEYWQGYNWTRGHSVYAPSQWEMALDCHIVTWSAGHIPRMIPAESCCIAVS